MARCAPGHVRAARPRLVLGPAAGGRSLGACPGAAAARHEEEHELLSLLPDLDALPLLLAAARESSISAFLTFLRAFFFSFFSFFLSFFSAFLRFFSSFLWSFRCLLASSSEPPSPSCRRLLAGGDPASRLISRLTSSGRASPVATGTIAPPPSAGSSFTSVFSTLTRDEEPSALEPWSSPTVPRVSALIRSSFAVRWLAKPRPLMGASRTASPM
mmetsp:Transcript_80460/g.227910  ORF Transcript_80460/g.227910 Transcript_80460/m.227910 type:complete len:215 (+) Transcript_80460:26-670(+)